MEQTGRTLILFIGVLIILGLFLVLLFLIFLKRKNALIKSKIESEQYFKQEIIKTQVEIREETMKHIGREIHDDVGQKLTLSSLYLQQLILENKAPQINTNLANVNEIINESLQELRQLSKSLTDDTIENSSIIELIEKECKKIRNLKQYSVFFKNELIVDVASYQIKSILLRITQEFMQNSVKHAECQNIHISLGNLENELQLQLKDDGKGFDIEGNGFKGIGLKNIKKRVEMLNGTSSIRSNEQGTVLTLKIPI